MNHSAPLPPRSPEVIDGILISMQHMGDTLDDDLNAIWAALTRPWWKRWRTPDREAMTNVARQQRIAYERLS